MIGQKQSSSFQTPTQPKRSRPYKNLLAICLFLLSFGIASSSIGYGVFNRYQQDNALAHAGAQELEKGISLLQTLSSDLSNTKVVSQAQQNFTTALATFSQLNNDVAFVPGMLTSAPKYGALLQSAKHLLPLAIEVSQAGIAGCHILNTILPPLRASSTSSKSSGLTMADMAVLSQNLQQIKILLNQATGQLKQLQPADLKFDPGLGKMVKKFDTYLPAIQQGIDQLAALPSALPGLIGVGKPAYYLVEILDSTELRPGGGFIGNYGIVTLTNGQLSSARVVDTYLLDQAYESTHHIPLPQDYSWFPFSTIPGWGLRDSNLSADFSTSAQNAEMLYTKEGGTLPLAGVIAITPTLIEHVLTLTGPINVPEYNETVTAQNLVEKIHYHQLIEDAAGGDVPSADGYSSVRKHFTALFSQYLLAHIRQMPSTVTSKLFQTLTSSLFTKDVQVYFNNDSAENLLQSYQIGDSVRSLTNDGIFVVDANVTSNKANNYILTTINDQVSIGQDGTATHHTVINFTWTESGLTAQSFYGPAGYRGYIRVYVPTNSAIQTQAGWTPYDSGTEYGDKYWGGYLLLYYPYAGSITLTWSVTGASQSHGHNWHYTYLLQRQAGIQQQMSLQVSLPECAKTTSATNGTVASNKQQVYLKQPLNKDTEVGIDYVCP